MEASSFLRLVSLRRAAIVACIGLLCVMARSQPAISYKQFDDSIVPLPNSAARVNVVGLDDDLRKLSLMFSLKMRNREELERRALQGPVPASEMTSRYGGDEAALRKLTTWLAENGFTDVKVDVEGTRVSATATARQIQKSLGAEMTTIRYQGSEYATAATPPRLPSDVGESVTFIGGLQPWVKATKHSVARKSVQVPSNGKSKTESRIKPRPAASTATTMKVVDVMRAYNAFGLGLTGQGQVVAILIDTVPNRSDLALFWQGNRMTVDQKRVEFVDVRGPKFRLPPVDGEESLDAEWASGIAPGAKVVVYAAGSTEYTDLDRALQRIYEDAKKPNGPRHVSISLGLREDLVSPAERRSEGELFLRLAALGVTVFVSSGDAGSNPDDSGHRRGLVHAPEYGSSDIWVVGVGGTTLLLDRNTGARIGETAWSDSGGGYSSANRPAWQIATNVAGQSFRGVPDVSSVADENPGAFVIRNGKEWPVGGTSWSTPVWAGFSALLAQGRERAGKQNVGFLGPTLYRIDRSRAFHDITAGGNGKYQSRAGWNEVTGLGTPDLAGMLEAIP